MVNLETLATYGTQDEDEKNNKNNKNKQKTICVGHRYAQTNTNNVNETWVLLLEVKTVLCCVFFFFNICFAIHSIAGNKSHGYCFLGLDFNVHKERQLKLTRICLAKLKHTI